MMTDREISLEIKRRLLMDNWINAKDIVIEVRNKIVTLRGEVDNCFEQQMALDDIFAIEDIKAVVNKISIQPKF